LTDRGVTRPRVGEVLDKPGHPRAGLPVPWVSPAETLKKMDEERRLATIWGKLCQVCGHGHEAEDPVVVFLGGKLENKPEIDDKTMVETQSDAVLCPWCAALTLENCPGLRRMWKGERGLLVCRTTAKYVDVWFHHNDGLVEDHPEPGVKEDPTKYNGSDPRMMVPALKCEISTPEEFLGNRN
jgi:hypothetical protein